MVFIIALVLLIWFRTDAWTEYTKLFRLNCLSDYKRFESAKAEDVMLTYTGFLRQYHNCFLVRLVTCPICLAVWLGIICGFFGHLWSIPFYVLGGLALFLIFDKLLG